MNPLGFGIGLRTDHYDEVLAGGAEGVDWFEVISENFFGRGGNPRRVLGAVSARYPVVLHGVGLSLGGTDALDSDYLDALASLARTYNPALMSDHLCWCGVGGVVGHDLYPLPYTEEALIHVAERIGQVQDRLGRRFLIENVSSYVQFSHSTLEEWEFLSALVARTGCGLLLDVNNVFVSAHNHGFDARHFIQGLPLGSVEQIHLAGHSQQGNLLIDTHDHPVPDGVWALYRVALERFGSVPTLVEWDDDIPSLEVVAGEARKARLVAAEVSGRVALGAT